MTEAPSRRWQEAAHGFAETCATRLWTREGAKALTWLRRRGLSDATIRSASFGFNPVEMYLKPPAWGSGAGVKIERGITIPWTASGEIWKLNVRRAGGSPKYKCVSGSKNGLFNADEIRPDRVIVLVEGEIDAWSIVQEARGIAWSVATGSTHGSRRVKWVARLMICPLVLVAYDSDQAGEDAASYWTNQLPNAVRWRPYWGDANDMLRAGADVGAWIEAGVKKYRPMNRST